MTEEKLSNYRLINRFAGLALLGKKVDDEFELQRPAGPMQYLVTAIRYSQ